MSARPQVGCHNVCIIYSPAVLERSTSANQKMRTGIGPKRKVRRKMGQETWAYASRDY